MADSPVFPGGTSVSHLRVYDWPAPDAPGGSGTPHLHTTSTEAYVVVAGRGRVETLGPEGFASHDLAPGRIVWFSPGVIHRAVNDGGLEVLVLMSNAGLPEAGDAVLTFPPDVLASAGTYRAAVTLPEPSRARSAAGPGGGDAPSFLSAARPPADGAADAAPAGRGRKVSPDALNPADDMAEDPVVATAARARRDLALEGYAALCEAVEARGSSALEPLYAAAARLVGSRADQWRELWTTTVARAASDTDHALAALAGAVPIAPDPDRSATPVAVERSVDSSRSDVTATARVPEPDGSDRADEPATAVGHLMSGTVAVADARPGPRRYGMCGRLRVWSTR